jgi:hypothetical protein
MWLGSDAGLASHIGCRPRLSGNTPQGRARQPATALAMTRHSSAPTAGLPISGPASYRGAPAAATQPRMALLKSESSSPIPGAYSICTATSGNGSRIAGHQTRWKFPPTDRLSRARGIVKWASFEAAVLPRDFIGKDQRFDSLSARRRTIRTMVFASPYHLPSELAARRPDCAASATRRPMRHRLG